MSQVQKIGQGVAVFAITSLLLSGCSQVIKTGANVALGFTEKHHRAAYFSNGRC